MSSKNHEDSGYNLDFNLLTILYLSRIPYPRSGGLVGKSNHLRPIYLSKTLWNS